MLEKKHKNYFPYLIDGLCDQTLFEAMSELRDDVLVYITDFDTGETVWSPNIREFYHAPHLIPAEALTLLHDRLHPDDVAIFEQEVEDLMCGRKSTHAKQWRVADTDGSYFLVDCDGTVKIDQKSGKRFFIGQIIRLDRSSIYDSLTNLPVYGQFVHLANQAMEKMVNQENAHAHVIYFDIHNFMSVNMEKGHERGDALLHVLAECLQKNFQGDIICRENSDHFVVLTTKEESVGIVESVQREFRHQVVERDVILKAGIYMLKSTEEDMAAAIDYAKTAVDAIRDAEQNIAFFDEKLQSRLRANKYVIDHLDEAIEQGWIKVYYQPVARAITGDICGFEALARWIDPELGFLSPAEFIPVLEETGDIYKVDQYVIQEVCRLIHQCDKSGQKMVPISVNLSRMDFFKCDIVAYVEETTERFNIARDMLNLEVTESVMMSDVKVMQDCVKCFRALGYQVWMDDFGSGYSSLNVLKNFHFDEIKLDMGFMRDFNDTAKNIVMTMIEMAKKLGITTLSEGVETEEQFAFLKSVGCEKIQGYLIGRPQPMEELLSRPADQALVLENRMSQTYYQKLKTLDFTTDRPLAVTEYDGEVYRFLFSNEAFGKEWDSLHLGEHADLRDMFRVNESQFWKRFQTLIFNIAIDDREHEMDYLIMGRTLRIRTRCIGKDNNRLLCTLEIANITRADDDGAYKETDLLKNILLNMNEACLICDLSRDTYHTVASSVFSTQAVDRDWESMSVAEGQRYAAEHYIQMDERGDFLAFVNPETVGMRLAKSDRNFLTRIFHTKNNAGAYIPKAHFIVNVPGTQTYYYFTRFVSMDEVNRTGWRRGSEAGCNDMETQVLSGLMHAESVNLFWKDRNRRFLGANQSFLNTFGMSGVEELIGKTDEDMGWNITQENFRDDEQNILELGVSVRNKLGRCVIDGVTCDILVTKEPLYHNGEIIGLWGMFTTVQSLMQGDRKPVNLLLKDPVSGLLSNRAILPTIIDYIEAYHVHGEDFAVISLEFPRYKHGVESYGQNVVNKLSARIGQVIREQVSYRGNCASLAGGLYVIYLKYRNMEEIQTLTQRIHEKLREIHQIEGYPVTVRPNVSVFLASQAADIQELLWRSMLMAAFDSLSDLDAQYHAFKTTRTILDRLPCAIAVFHRSKDGKLTRQYISQYTQKFTGKKDEHEAEQAEIMSIIHPDDLPWVQKRVIESIRANEGLDETYRVVSAEGQIFWVRHISNAVPQPDGGCNFYAVYSDVTAEKEAEEKKREVSEHIVNKLPCGVVAYQISPNRHDIAYLYASERLDDVLHLDIDAKGRKIETMTDLVHEEDSERIHGEVYHALATYNDLHTQFRIIGKDGVLRWFDFVCTFDVANDESATAYVVYSDITERKVWEEDHLIAVGEADALPKTEISRRFRRMLENGENAGFAMLMLDVDNLKYINDHFGHPVGDVALQSIVDVLRTVFRRSDLMGKVGGDEFMMFLDGFGDANGLRKKLEQVIRLTGDVLLVEDPPYRLSCSIGAIVSETRQGVHYDDLYASVDKALYEAKQNGKNGFVIRELQKSN